MKRQRILILRVILFIAIFIVLDRVLGLVLTNFSKEIRSSGPVGMINKAIKYNADIYILGSSRAMHHFDCDVIEDVFENKKIFNAGRDGNGLPYSLVVAELIFNKCKPKLIVLQVEPGDFNTRVFKGHLLRLANIASFIDISKEARNLIFSTGNLQKIKYMSSTFRFNSQLLYFIFDIIKKDSFPNGYVPLNKSFNPALLDITNEAKDIVEIEEEAFNVLRKIIRLVKGNNAKIVMVTSPRWYKNGIMPKEHKKISKLIEEVAEKENTPYININQESYTVFKDSVLFADSAHLNKEGAKIFSKIAADKIIEFLD